MSAIKQRYKSNEVVVNNKSNFKSHLVRCQDILDNLEFDELVLKALGKAIKRAINLADQLNLNNYNTFEIEKRPYTVEIIEDKSRKRIRGHDKDRFDPDSVDMSTKKVIQVPAIEVVVRKSKEEISKMRKANTNVRQLLQVKL